MTYETDKEHAAEAAMRAMKQEHRRLTMSAAGIQETLQGGEDGLVIVDLEFCKIIQRIASKPECERAATERALVNRLDDLAWEIASRNDYSDALTQEKLTRDEAKWEAKTDCALLEPQA